MDVCAIVAAGAPAAGMGAAAALIGFLAGALAGRRRGRAGLRREEMRLLAIVSHEIRTPLSAILGMADLLRRAGLSPEDAGAVEAIRTSGAALLALVDRTLDLARIEAGRLDLTLGPVDLRRLVEGVVDLLAPSARAKGLELAASIGASVPPIVRADAVRLRQALVNLAGNAVKFTGRGGACVAVERGEGDLLRFAVIDTGPGVPPDRREAIFEPFERGDGADARGVEGAGLGLAISRRLVRLMGGTLTLEDNPGGGSIFSFTMSAPACDEPAHGGEAVAPTPRPRPRRRALVAEDCDVNALIAETALRRLGFEPVRARDGDEAVRLACARRPDGPPFDLILMDLRMPGLDGFEATRRLRRREREGGARPSPIVALSADPLGVGSGREAPGFDAVLVKPFGQDDLAATIDRLLAPNDRTRDRLARLS